MTVKPATTYSEIVGHILVRLRKERGYNQGDLASRMGINQPSWSRIERAQTSLTVDQLVVAARAVGTTPGDVLAQADAAAEHLRQQGVKVLTKKSASGIHPAVAAIGGAGLAILVARALETSKHYVLRIAEDDPELAKMDSKRGIAWYVAKKMAHRVWLCERKNEYVYNIQTEVRGNVTVIWFHVRKLRKRSECDLDELDELIDMMADGSGLKRRGKKAPKRYRSLKGSVKKLKRRK